MVGRVVFFEVVFVAVFWVDFVSVFVVDLDFVECDSLALSCVCIVCILVFTLGSG